MLNFIDSYKDIFFRNNKPWIILGKGQSLDKLEVLPDIKNEFNLFSLNHAALFFDVDVAHFIDIEALNDCRVNLHERARYLLMPLVPHVRMKAGIKTLTQYLEENPVLETFDKKNRLLFYDLKDLEIKYFSGEAALALLARCGAKTIRSLGLDGGSGYSKRFDSFKKKSLLANNQTSFDQQFKQFPFILNKYKINYSPLDFPMPVKIFVGGSREEWLPAKVLEFSIKKTCSITSDVRFLFEENLDVPVPKKKENQPRTNFSFQRFFIPQLCKYQGKALYLDSDMIVHKDLRHIFKTDMKEAELIHVASSNKQQMDTQFAVMLLNCEKLDWKPWQIIEDLDQGKYSYQQLMQEMVVADRKSPSISVAWNQLDTYTKGINNLTHFTDSTRQPWKSEHSPAGAIWMETLFQAIKEGYIDISEVEREAELNHIRPSLPEQVKINFAQAETEKISVP